MSRYELCDVLLRVFGFTVAARAALAFPQSMVTFGAYLFRDPSSVQVYMGWQVVAIVVGTFTQVAGGIAIIVMSSSIARLLARAGGRDHVA